MSAYHAPVDDIQFLLEDVFRVDRYSNLPGFSDAPRDVRNAIINEAARLSEKVLHPLNAVGDREGCKRNGDATVDTPSGFREAYAELGEGGWVGLSSPTEYGGQGLPSILLCAVDEMFISANMSLEMFAALTRSAASALLAHASDQQKSRFVPKMLSGKWGGTMNLTEPHCGTDLGLMRTKASAQSDGTYKISGTKIFISSGEHEVTENIIHLVLARIEGAPSGIKGVSLFIVPKHLINEDGSLGSRNRVSCGAIENKMGIHGNPTCVLNYEEATGYLVGRENKGMEAMFVMMNEARLGVGLQGLALSEIAYQNAAAYAKERLQGRALGGAVDKEKVADPIIVHPDVRRTLQEIRAFNQAARALVFSAALRSDLAHRSAEPAVREATEEYLSLMTPVIKGALTDWGFANTVSAQQLFGGHGFIVETGMEQFVRDARITKLYEGANGIQALDLVARKLPRNNGRAIEAFIGEIDRIVQEAGKDPRLAEAVRSLDASVSDLRSATKALFELGQNDINQAVAGSTDYLHLVALVALGHMWVIMMQAALEKMDQGEKSLHLSAKLSTGSFFLDRMLPQTSVHLKRVCAAGRDIMTVPADAF